MNRPFFFILFLILFSSGLYANTFVYIVSTDSPEAIFDQGFVSWSPTFGDSNLLLHISGYSVYQRTTRLITAAYDNSVNPADASANTVYLYRIRADRSFYNVPDSLNLYADEVANSTFERAVVNNVLSRFAPENQVVVQGGINPENIESATLYTYVPATNRYMAQSTEENPHYENEESEINPLPFPISHEELQRFITLSLQDTYGAANTQGQISSIGLCTGAYHSAYSIKNNSNSSNDLTGCRNLVKITRSEAPLNLLNNETICTHSFKSDCAVVLNSADATVFTIHSNTLYNLGQPEPDHEITAIGNVGGYVYVGTSSGNTYVRNIYNDYKWWVLTPKIPSLITAISKNSGQISTRLFLGTQTGEVYERVNGYWTKLGQLPSSITTMLFDEWGGGYLYIGTSNGNTYVRGVTEAYGTFWKISGMSNPGAITTFTMEGPDYDYLYLFAGTAAGKVYYLKAASNEDFDQRHKPAAANAEWQQEDGVSGFITSLVGCNQQELYLATSNGSIYTKYYFKSYPWNFLGSPGGPDPTMLSTFGSDAGCTVWLLNNLSTVYKKEDGSSRWVYYSTL